MDREPDPQKPDTPAEAMESSESEFEKTVKEDAADAKTRPMGEGARTPASPPSS